MNRIFGMSLLFVAAALMATTLAQDEVWLFVEQPRCCSDCTFVQGRFKCKLKSCLSKCPFPKKNASQFPAPQPDEEEDEEEEERRQREERNQQTEEPEINNGSTVDFP